MTVEMPVVSRDAKGEDFVDPVFRLSSPSSPGMCSHRERPWNLIFVCQNVNELEVEEDNHGDPLLHGSVWLNIQIWPVAWGSRGGSDGTGMARGVGRGD